MSGLGVRGRVVGRARVRLAAATIPIVALTALCACGGGSAGTSGTTTSSSAASQPAAGGSSSSSSGSSSSSTSAGSSGGSGAAAGSTPNPCTLITREDAKGVLGADPGQPIHSTVDVADTCTYHAGTKLVSLVLRKVSKAAFENSAAKTGGAKPLSGLGPDAYQSDDLVLFWKSGVLVAVGVDGGSQRSLPDEETLAKKAMSRL